MYQGRILKSGGKELADKLDQAITCCLTAGFGLGVVMVVAVVVAFAVVAIVTNTHASSHNLLGFSE
jgi:hypothetical protein